MKKLFENKGGNNFRLLTEARDVSSVHSGIKKLFSNGDKKVSYTCIETIGVGMGYISDVTGARKHALDEARKLAEEFNYTDDENSAAFVKSEVNHNWDVKDFSGTEEKREVQIGKEILNVIDSPGMDRTMETEKGKLRKLADELIQMHGKK